MSEETNKSGGWRSNKWIRAAIPALLLHCSIGTVYCWSIFSEEIGNYIGFKKSSVEWAFSFAIFFLGMSAAFLGNVVEKDIHKSSLIATICFASGMALTGFFIYYGGEHQGSMLSLIGIYISYGFIMGVGLGTGYLSPVKTERALRPGLPLRASVPQRRSRAPSCSPCSRAWARQASTRCSGSLRACTSS